jgi:hypothetical protein
VLHDLPDAGPGLRWEPVPDMVVGTWVEVPVDDDGPPRWLRVVATKPPSWTGEYRWALSVRDDDGDWWVKVSPDLLFRVCDRDPAVG